MGECGAEWFTSGARSTSWSLRVPIGRVVSWEGVKTYENCGVEVKCA